uniref:Uncharacterized protein n=1 Tax=Plectus sambesii TaxID=2011161 RepID=A0A914WS56_9BILA
MRESLLCAPGGAPVGQCAVAFNFMPPSSYSERSSEICGFARRRGRKQTAPVTVAGVMLRAAAGQIHFNITAALIWLRYERWKIMQPAAAAPSGARCSPLAALAIYAPPSTPHPCQPQYCPAATICRLPAADEGGSRPGAIGR